MTLEEFNNFNYKDWEEYEKTASYEDKRGILIDAEIGDEIKCKRSVLPEMFCHPKHRTIPKIGELFYARLKPDGYIQQVRCIRIDMGGLICCNNVKVVDGKTMNYFELRFFIDRHCYVNINNIPYNDDPELIEYKKKHNRIEVEKIAKVVHMLTGVECDDEKIDEITYAITDIYG